MEESSPTVAPSSAEKPIKNPCRSTSTQFQPASIEGIVLDRSKAERPPIAGAQVELKEDLDNDGVIDFTASTTTGADGKYKIYVPVGNRSYTPLITIPVQVGNQTISMKISQRTNVGELSGIGQTINAQQNISGKLMVGQADGNGAQEIQQVFSGNNVTASLLTSTGDVLQGTVQVNQDGSFNIQNVLPGEYTVRFNITAPNGEQLASQTAQVSVRQEGEMSVAVTLIDPYGLVSDETSGKSVSGVNMQLYWADTTLNSGQGRQAKTLVNLPEIPNFPPNRNLVPQLTSSTGEYAWMVFPNGDYYIIAEKSGYQTYDSREEKRNVAAKPGEDSTVTPEKAGDYTVTYNVTDSAGNIADQVLRTVHVSGVGRVDRLSGWDSVDTALEIAKASYPGKVRPK